jgi:preprotein translocase subunit SecE
MGETAKKSENTPKKSWFKGLKAEFKKIIWTDKESLIKQSTAVVAASVVLGIVISVVDVVIKYGIEFLIG